MDVTERPRFESDAGRRIYEYVERHGTAQRNVLLDVVSVPAEEFREHLDRLKSKGYLQEESGTLQLSLNVGSVEEYESDGVAFTVRPARQDDFEGLVETIRDVTAEETYVVAESVAEQLLYQDTVNRHNSVSSRVFFVAAVEGEVVGWTHLDLPQLAKVRETAGLTVGVQEDYRGHGIGGKLLARGLEWAEANGYRKLYNSVPVTNERAIQFLTNHGWETEATRTDHYSIGDEYVDEAMMAYRF